MEGDDGVAVFVERVQEAPRGVRGEEARRAPERQVGAGKAQQAGARVHHKHRDAVVAAVGRIDEAPAVVHFDPGRAAVAGEGFGQRRQDLQRCELRRVAVVRIRRHGRVQLVDDIRIAAVGMEGNMPRPGRLARLDKAGRRRRQPAVGKAEGEGAVQSLVRNDDEVAGRIERVEMGLGLLLLDPVRADWAIQLDQLRHLAQRALAVQRQYREAGANVIGHHHKPLARVQRQVNGVLAVGALAVDEFQPPAGTVDREGADVAHVAMHAVQAVAAAVQRQERRVDEIADDLHRFQCATAGLHAKHADALTAGVALTGGPGADIGVHELSFRWSGLVARASAPGSVGGVGDGAQPRQHNGGSGALQQVPARGVRPMRGI
ncbi:hypothetical protein Tamer19_74480 [Cupriavidus sp. TA19]|nr:hypothetical protein Tamer19_74480 [Cupriavidus sp. TA19]